MKICLLLFTDAKSSDWVGRLENTHILLTVLEKHNH